MLNLFLTGGWNTNVGSKVIPGMKGKFGLGEQNEAGQRLTEFCQENALVIANTPFQQHKRWLYTWTTPNGQNWSQIDYILCSRRWRSCIQLAKIRPGADCGSDHQFLIENSLVAQMVKNPPAMWKTWVRSLGWEDPLEKEKATHSSILAWIPWTV